MTHKFAKYVSQNIVGMLGMSCYIIVDTFFISVAAGADGIAALNLALPVFNLIFAIGSMIGIGGATRFSILRAQKDERADNYFTNAVLWATMLGLIFSVIGIIGPEQVIRLMGGDAHLVEVGLSYNRIILLFGPFFMLNAVFSGFVRNDGDPSLAMVATLVGSLANVVFDYIFMFPMGMGLTGAALATAASPVISIAICSAHFWKKSNTLRFMYVLPSVKRLIQSCSLGISAFIGDFASAVTTTVFNYLIIGLVGNIGVSAYGVIANYAIVVIAVFNGIAQGAQPLISDAYGRGEKKEQKTYLKLGMATALAFAALFYVVSWLFTDTLVALFNSEGIEVLASYAKEGMRLYFIGFIFAGVNIFVSSYLSATAKANTAFVVSILRGVVAIVLCSVVLSHFLGLKGVWLAFPVAEFLTLIYIVEMFAIDGKNKVVSSERI